MDRRQKIREINSEENQKLLSGSPGNRIGSGPSLEICSEPIGVAEGTLGGVDFTLFQSHHYTMLVSARVSFGGPSNGIQNRGINFGIWVTVFC